MSVAVKVVYKWQINSSKFLYLLSSNFSYVDKTTWGFVSRELTNSEEEAIKRVSSGLNEKVYEEVFNYMRDDVLVNDVDGKYLSLLDYSCYYTKNPYNILVNKIGPTTDFETIASVSTKTVDNDKDAVVYANIEDNSTLDTRSLTFNFGFEIPKGKDGHTPVIGVKKEGIGDYFWTVDGEFLLDENGEKVRANGTDGVDGEDGIGARSKTIMIYNTCQRDSSGNIIKDENGDVVPPTTPTGGNFDWENNTFTAPIGWTNINTVKTPVFMSTKLFYENESLNQYEEWSAPVQITGADGVAGKDGESVQFVFYRTNDNIINAELVEYTIDKDTNEEYPIYEKNGKRYEFKDNAEGVNSVQKTEYYCIRNKKGEEWSSWNGPYVWSNFGSDGQDSDTIEYIYKLYREQGDYTDEKITPNNYQENSDYQKRGYVPTHLNWTPNPNDVSEYFPYQYVSIRKYDGVQKLWGKFSDPTLWNNFGFDGKGKMLYPAGEYSDIVEYKIENDAAPYIYIVDDNRKKHYFFLKSNDNGNKGVIGKNPIESENEKYWGEMQSFNAFYAELLVAKYGTIGGAVFYDDSCGNQFMFSMDGGYNAKGDNTVEYPHFLENIDDGSLIDRLDEYANNPLKVIKEKSKFVPNILLNFKNGEAWFGGGSTIFKADGSGVLADGGIEWNKNRDKTILGIKGNIKTYNKKNEVTSIMGDIDITDFDITHTTHDNEIQSVSKAILVAGITDFNSIKKYVYTRKYPEVNEGNPNGDDTDFPDEIFTDIDLSKNDNNNFANAKVNNFYYLYDGNCVSLNHYFKVLTDDDKITLDNGEYIESDDEKWGVLKYDKDNVNLLYEEGNKKVIYQWVNNTVSNIEQQTEGNSYKKNANTVISDDGSIITQSLYAEKGSFSGDINSNGVFKGVLENASGTLKDVHIDNYFIDNQISNNKNIILSNSGITTDAISSEFYNFKFNDFYHQNKSASSKIIEETNVLFSIKDINFNPDEKKDLYLMLMLPKNFSVSGHRYHNKQRKNLSEDRKALPTVNVKLVITYSKNRGEEDKTIDIPTDTKMYDYDWYSGGYRQYYISKIDDLTKTEHLHLKSKENENYYDVDIINTLDRNGVSEFNSIKKISLIHSIKSTVWGRQGADYETFAGGNMKNGKYKLYETDENGKEIDTTFPKLIAGTNKIVLYGGGLTLEASAEGIILYKYDDNGDKMICNLSGLEFIKAAEISTQS